MNSIGVVDNFLDIQTLETLQNIIFDKDFPLFWNGEVIEGGSDDPSNYYLNHLLYDKDNGINSPHFDVVYAMFAEKMGIEKPIRIKVNVYPSNTKQVENGYHIDYDFPHKGAIFSLNTCDGYTKFQTGQIVDSVVNRMMFFDPTKAHTSANTTNVKRRVNINFNYY